MKENKESKGTQFEEEKILLTEDQVKDQTEIKEETEKDDMVHITKRSEHVLQWSKANFFTFFLRVFFNATRNIRFLHFS